jgi:hypothetical protein
MAISALLIVAIIVLVIGIALIIWGGIKAYKDTHPASGGSVTSDFTGWMLVVAGIIASFIAIILLVVNFYHKKYKGVVVPTKTKKMVNVAKAE